jgi:hypothetical protein
MSALVKEARIGRSKSGKQSGRTYYITGVDTEDDALAAMLTDSGVPTVQGTFIRNDAACTVEELESGTTTGTGRFLGKTVYLSPDLIIFQQPHTFNISFDIAGQTTHITQSLQTVNSYAPSGVTPKSFHGAINVQQDGTVEGTDIVTPVLNYTISYTFLDGDVTTDLINTFALIVGTVNSSSFHGYDAGELLLTRVSGAKRNDGSNLWDITFGFAVSRNCTSGELPNGDAFVINTIKPDGTAGTITITTKNGWDYLWVRYEERDVGTGATAATMKVPVSAYVERVYLYTDYSTLGIGT